MPDEPTLDLGIPDPPEPPALSAGARLTARQHALVERGIHPLTKEQARPDLGTCGTCVHRVQRGGTATAYPKCDHPGTPISKGAATDVRASWPACHRHEARDG